MLVNAVRSIASRAGASTLQKNPSPRHPHDVQLSKSSNPYGDRRMPFSFLSNVRLGRVLASDADYGALCGGESISRRIDSSTRKTSPRPEVPVPRRLVDSSTCRLST